MIARGLLFAMLTVAFVGCGPPARPVVTLQGEVTIDGEPLSNGMITFVPVGKDMGPEATAEVVAGKYRGEVPRGKLKAFLQGTRETGKMVEEYGVQRAELVSAIPERYQAGIELDTASAPAEHHFHLTTAR